MTIEELAKSLHLHKKDIRKEPSFNGSTVTFDDYDLEFRYRLLSGYISICKSSDGFVSYYFHLEILEIDGSKIPACKIVMKDMDLYIEFLKLIEQKYKVKLFY